MEGENLNKQQQNENSIEIPKSIVIKGYTLYYKSPPLKNDIYRFRYRKGSCKYFVKIDKENLKNLDSIDKEITYIEINKHENHIESGDNKINKDLVKKEKEIINLAEKLIRIYCKEPL